MSRTIAILLVLAAACTPRTTVQTIARRVETRNAAPSSVGAAGFVAAVPAFEGGGHCSNIPLERGERLVVLRYDGPDATARNVSLRFDSVGTLRSYSDVRGDLRLEGAGAKTAVTLGFDNGTGSAMNEHASGDATQGIVLARPEEMLELPNLGTPRRMIETVKARCGG